MYDDRTYLDNNAVLYLRGREYHITGLEGAGTSSIVYHATVSVSDNSIKTEKKVLIKELYPMNLSIVRNKTTGALIIPKRSQNNFIKYIESFKKAVKLQIEFHNPLEEESDTLSATNSTSSIEDVCEHGNTLYSVMSIDNGQTYDKYDNDDLRSHIEICKNLAEAIWKYHKRGYLHLDIKPKNIFVLAGSNQIKLFDFDTVQLKGDINNRNCRVSFTEEFAPPELYLITRDRSYYGQIDQRSDIYLIGATLFYKLFGRTPSFSDRFPYKTWDFGESTIARTASPQVKDQLTVVLRKTLAQLREGRYNDVSELLCAFDCILDLLKFKYNLVNQNIYKTSGDYYIPRTQEIKQIRNILNENHIAYLYGMGGIGKSETARAYVEEYRNDYSVIQFIGYQTDLAKAIASLSFSDDEGFNDNAHNEDDRYKMVFTRLSGKLLNNERTLIIIDNYNYISDAAKDISEKDQKVLETNRKVLQDLTKLSIHFIFTTRNKPLPHDIKKRVEINEFTSDELRELFFQINPRYKDDPERVKKVDKILELTGYHTLTVDLIARQSASIEGMGNHTLDDLIDVISRSGINNEVDVIVPNNKDEKDTYDIVYNHIKALFDFNQLSDMEEYVLATAALLPVTGMKEKDFCELIAIDKVSNHPTGWGLNKTITKLVESGWLCRNSHMKYDENDPLFKPALDTGAIINETVSIVSMHPLIADTAINELGFDSVFFKYFSENLEYHYKEKWCIFDDFWENNVISIMDSPEYIVINTCDEMIIRLLYRAPINHNNFVFISKLAYVILCYQRVSDFDAFLHKANEYIDKNENNDPCDLAWYYKLLCIRYCIYRLPQKIVPPEYTNSINENDKYNNEAKKFAILSFEYFSKVLDNADKADLAEEFAIAFWYSHDFETAFSFRKLSLKYSKKTNDKKRISHALYELGQSFYNYVYEIDIQADRIRYLKYSELVIKQAINLYNQLPQNNQDKLMAWTGFLKQIRFYIENPSSLPLYTLFQLA